MRQNGATLILTLVIIALLSLITARTFDVAYRSLKLFSQKSLSEQNKNTAGLESSRKYISANPDWRAQNCQSFESQTSSLTVGKTFCELNFNKGVNFNRLLAGKQICNGNLRSYQKIPSLFANSLVTPTTCENFNSSPQGGMISMDNLVSTQALSLAGTINNHLISPGFINLNSLTISENAIIIAGGDFLLQSLLVNATKPINISVISKSGQVKIEKFSSSGTVVAKIEISGKIISVPFAYTLLERNLLSSNLAPLNLQKLIYSSNTNI